MEDRKRPGVFDEAAKEKFLAAMVEGYSVTAAASRAGVHRRTVYLHRDGDFRREWDEALEQGCDYLEDLMLEKAKAPGGFMANVALLRARRPLQWRENVKVDLTAKGDHRAGVDLRKLSDAELLEMERLMLKAGAEQEPTEPIDETA